MSNDYLTIRFSTWDELYSSTNSFDNWIFRGQSDASWALTSSLERARGVEAGSTSCWDHCEKWMMRKFKGGAHHFLHHVPDADDQLEWTALMQHHGAPTRLLDCSYSFPISAFFAAIDARPKTEFAVWGINWAKVARLCYDRFGLKGKIKFTGLEIQEKMHEMANQFLDRKASGSLVFPVEPKRQNERISVQQGLFLFPCDAARTFMKNLSDLFGEDIEPSFDEANAVSYDPAIHVRSTLTNSCMLKLILPYSERWATLDALHRMNISSASLFPGLDGFARSLIRYARQD